MSCTESVSVPRKARMSRRAPGVETVREFIEHEGCAARRTSARRDEQPA